MFDNSDGLDYKEQQAIRKRVALRKLEGKIKSLQMLIDNAPKDVQEKMRKTVKDSFNL